MIAVEEDSWGVSYLALKGMKRQLEIAGKSGIEYHIQKAEHYKKSYYDIKVYESVSSAEDCYYNCDINPRGRKRLIKIDNGVMTVVKEQMGHLL